MTHIAELADVPVEELRPEPVNIVDLILRERELAQEAVENLYEQGMLGIQTFLGDDPIRDELADEMLADRNFAIRFIRGYA